MCVLVLWHIELYIFHRIHWKNTCWNLMFIYLIRHSHCCMQCIACSSACVHACHTALHNVHAACHALDLSSRHVYVGLPLGLCQFVCFLLRLGVRAASESIWHMRILLPRAVCFNFIILTLESSFWLMNDMKNFNSRFAKIPILDTWIVVEIGEN
jgi:hypothetical protein